MLCEPRIARIPPRSWSAGQMIVDLSAKAGIRLDETQAYAADAIAGVGADGKWSAYEGVIFAPRQNMKTELMIARMLTGLFVFGEEAIVYSAHLSATATKMFERMLSYIDNSPLLEGRIAKKTVGAGRERILVGGGRGSKRQSIDVMARSTRSGRGFTADLVILDEAQDLTTEQLAAISPAVATRRNPQLLYALSQGNEQTSHLGGLRERVLTDCPGVCWLEWSMADDDDVSDPRVWAACNPAYHAVPPRITMEYLGRQFRSLGPDAFAVEHLGLSSWPSGEPGEWGTIGRAAWEACCAEGAQLEEVSVPAAIDVPLPDDSDGAFSWHNTRLGRV